MAAPESDPGDLGAQSLPTTTKTNCTATVENEKVSTDDFFMRVYATLRMEYLCTYFFVFLSAVRVIRVTPRVTGEFTFLKEIER